MKTLLILADGMRPDAIANLEKVQKTKKISSYTLSATTVFPSVTLPCHMSLFHSVEPSRHGTTTNTYAPQVRPVKGLAEVLKGAGKKNATFYSWEELKDITRPASLVQSYYCDFPENNRILTDFALQNMQNQKCDFIFLYYHSPDTIGHKYGWMTQEYLDEVKAVWEIIDEVIEKTPDEYNIVITADHGGHDRIHGENIPEDMLIPLFFIGKDIKQDYEIKSANIIDIAPTITELMNIPPDEDWEGKSLLNEITK